MQRINFQDTEVIKAPYVNINGTEYPVQSNFQGGTDLNAETFNELQDNIEEAISEVQPTIEEWKDFPTGQFTYANFLEEYKSLLFNCDIPTLLDYIKESFMIVKFKYNGTTYYGCITGVGRYGLTLYTGSQTGFDTGTYSDFQYTYNKYLEEIPEDLTWNFIQFLSDGSIIDDNIIGFYANQPVLEPLTVYKTTKEIVGVWKDGRPIYRECFEIQNVVAKSEQSFSLPNIDFIIDLKGSLQTANECYPVQYNNILDTSHSQTFIVKANNRTTNTINYYAGTTGTARIIVEYVEVQARKTQLPLWPEIPQTKGGDE